MLFDRSEYELPLLIDKSLSSVDVSYENQSLDNDIRLSCFDVIRTLKIDPSSGGVTGAVAGSAATIERDEYLNNLVVEPV